MHLVEIDGVKYIPFVEKSEGNALDIVFEHRDLGAPITIREFFRYLLATLWVEEDGFSGKRPWGNSGWQFDVIYALIEHGYLKGSVEYDEDGYVQESTYDREEAEQYICALIAQMCLGEE